MQDPVHKIADADVTNIPGDEHPQPASDSERQPTLVIGLGGSAGSLESLQKFFLNLPENAGMAYVVVVHLAAEHESMMAEILQRATVMPVSQVVGTVEIQPDHVYVIPPGKQLSTDGGMLRLSELNHHSGRHVAVDFFFRSLAESHGPAAIAVVLSGGDGDGAIGLKRIKEMGGLAIAQDPDEAAQPGMPQAAIATGMVDWILPVEEIPSRLIQYQKNGRSIQLPLGNPPPELPDEGGERGSDEITLRNILAFLRVGTGHDFSNYKRATILRRVGRRMQVNGTEDLDSYLAFLQTHPAESGALLQDLLISVTNFFRDREAFHALESIIPELFLNKRADDPVRVWLPGCATGEEAYSIAILLAECATRLQLVPQIQIFATDLDQVAIATAREGVYPELIAADVSDERLQRFFTKETDGYRVQRTLRETILFAAHDVLKDSPFSRLDLISCRNMLIYLKREAQMKVFDIFHFALRPQGFLFLGSSESAEDVSQLFSPYDKKNRIYRREPASRPGLSVPVGAPTLSFAMRARLHVPVPEPTLFRGVGEESLSRTMPGGGYWGEFHLKLIERIAPPSLVIDRDHTIVHLSKRAGEFLLFAGGEPTANLLRVIHPELKTHLRAALFRAAESAETVEIKGIPWTVDGPAQVDISVTPAGELASGYSLVTFHRREAASASVTPVSVVESSPADISVVQHLEEEVDRMRSGWRETVEQYEASLVELKASNEELQAMNEELRSATEELETGREELQSINEEISTINHELKTKVDELSRANSDLQNLMASTQIATIFLDRRLRIKRFTPSTAGLFNFIPSDIGRPLSDLSHCLEYPEIATDAGRVLEDLSLLEREVRNVDGRWFLSRMSPYRTADDQVAGVVITCVDITDRKQADDKMRWLSAMVESSNDAIMSFTTDGTIVSWNHGAERVFGYGSHEVTGQSLCILAPPDRSGECMELIDKLLGGETVDQFETVRICKDGRLIDVAISASVLKNEAGEISGAVAILQDITFRKKALQDLNQARAELEEKVELRTAELRQKVRQLARMASELTLTEERERKRMAYVLHDQLQQVLVAAKMRIESLESADDERRKIETTELISLLDEALANSRSLAVELSPPVLGEGLGKALDWLCGTWIKSKYDLTVNTNIDRSIDARQVEIRNLVFVTVKELLFNVVKHSSAHEAWVELAVHDSENFRVTVRDSGQGFDLNVLGSRNGTSSGFGLASVHERLEMLGGSLEIRSQPGQGVEAIILAPIKEPAQPPPS